MGLTKDLGCEGFSYLVMGPYFIGSGCEGFLSLMMPQLYDTNGSCLR